MLKKLHKFGSLKQKAPSRLELTSGRPADVDGKSSSVSEAWKPMFWKKNWIFIKSNMKLTRCGGIEENVCTWTAKANQSWLAPSCLTRLGSTASSNSPNHLVRTIAWEMIADDLGPGFGRQSIAHHMVLMNPKVFLPIRVEHQKIMSGNPEAFTCSFW
jgi:hypothetical protein